MATSLCYCLERVVAVASSKVAPRIANVDQRIAIVAGASATEVLERVGRTTVGIGATVAQSKGGVSGDAKLTSVSKSIHSVVTV